jgi:hypothetical protein
VLRIHGADAIMIGAPRKVGHGSFAKSVTISTRAHLPPPTVAEARAAILRHLDDHYAFYGEGAGVRIARKHLGWYTKELAGGEAFRREVNALETSLAQLAAVGRFFDTLAEGGARSTIARRSQRSGRPSAFAVTTRIATGRGGPGRVRKTLRINTGNEIGKTVEKSLDEYFRSSTASSRTASTTW